MCSYMCVRWPAGLCCRALQAFVYILGAVTRGQTQNMLNNHKFVRHLFIFVLFVNTEVI